MTIRIARAKLEVKLEEAENQFNRWQDTTIDLHLEGYIKGLKEALEMIKECV